MTDAQADATSDAPPDGDYDVFVLDVVDAAVDSGAGAGQQLELTIVAGELKGQVVTVTSDTTLGAFVDLVGMPGTLQVRDGRPTVSIDD